MPRAPREYEPEMIRKLVLEVNGNTARAASLMGCHQATVEKAIKQGITTRRQEVAATNALDELQLEREKAEARATKAKKFPVEPVVALPALYGDELKRALAEAPASDQMVLDKPAMVLVSVPADKIYAFNKVANLMGIEQVSL